MATDKINLLHALFLDPGKSSRQQAWQPRVDVYRTPGGWLVKFELAGVQPKDIRLSVEGRTLRMQGTRRDESFCAGLDCYSLEIAYSRFERVLELPGLSEAADISATYQNGMLLVRIEMEEQP